MENILSIIIIFYLTTTITCIYFLRFCKELTRHVNGKKQILNLETYKPTLSIIIPTYNEAILIEDKIINTLKLDYPSDLMEIMVIDSASTDGTADIAEKFEGITVIKQKIRNGKSAALAEAFDLVKNEIIVITDADAMLDDNCLNYLIDYLSDELTGAVTGRQILLASKDVESHAEEKSYRDIFDFIRNAESNMSSTMIFNGPLMAFKRKVLAAPAANSVADDTEMAIQVIKKGYNALYAPEAIFYENIPLSNKSRLEQKERRAQGLVQSFWRHKDMLFNKKYGSFGTQIFPAEFAVHIILPFELMASFILSLIGLYYNPLKTIMMAAVFLFIVGTYAVNVYSSVGKYLKNDDDTANSNIVKSIMITAGSFLQLQYALLMGAIKLSLFGSRHTWEQIADARYKDV